MAAELLHSIHSPADLKALDYPELDRLALELRAQMVATTSESGGHLASSLGAVEIILALHRVLDCPKDRIVFDVGHQAYAHKLLTGRQEAFSTLRSFGGLSGFPKIDESPYDSNDAGHASDSLSIALGYALARDLDSGDETIAALIGDASFTGGMALEALNQIGHLGTRVIIVLNDNGMSISPNVGGFAHYLGQMRLSHKYTHLRDKVEGTMTSSGRVGRALMDAGNAVKESVKQLVLPDGSMFFEEFGVTYVGPIDGHDIAGLETILRRAKDLEGPVVVHAMTDKGRGYPPAEAHPERFHGVGPFDIATGEPVAAKGGPTYTDAFSDTLVDLAADDERVVAITAAMSAGTGLDAFREKFPQRFFDVGIAEENAVGMASALAAGGKVPVVAIYSTFLQRAYDQIMVDVALQRRHVVFAVDRAGLVGADGPTHHGAFDLSYLRTVPGMRIMAPADAVELRAALRFAVACGGGPIALRYPRGKACTGEGREHPVWEPGRAVKLADGDAAAILALGRTVHVACESARALAEMGHAVAVYDMRWAKPVDADAVRAAAATGLVYTLEDNTTIGGFGSAVLECLASAGQLPRVRCIGYPDEFVEQGSVPELFAKLGLSKERLVERIAADIEGAGVASGAAAGAANAAPDANVASGAASGVASDSRGGA